MLGLDAKAVRATWSVVLTLGAFAFLYEARRTVLIFLLAVFFAYLLAPLVSLVDRFRQQRLSRTLSLAIVYVVLIVILIFAGGAIVTRASQEALSLINQVPDLSKTSGILETVPLPSVLEPLRDKASALLKEQLETGVTKALPLLRATFSQLLSALGNLGFALLVPILGFFFLKDGEQLRAAVLDLFGKGSGKAFFDGLLHDVHAMLGQYIRALFLLSLATFTASLLFFQIAGVPNGALLATTGAVLEFIPVIGPLSAAIIACVAAWISGYSHIVPMAIFFAVYRVFQDYVLQPFLLGHGVALHPLLIVFGALAGEQIAGIAGMVFSVPILATLRLIHVRAMRKSS